MLLMYVFSVYVTPGSTGPPCVFGIVGATACLIVTLAVATRRRRAAAAPAASPATVETTP